MTAIRRATSIVSRYLVHQRGLVRDAIARLTAEEQPEEEAVAAQKDEQEASIERTISLNERRLDAVFEVLKASGASRVLDLGCGEGKLLRRLLADHQFAEIVGMDVSGRVLDLAESRLKLDRLAPKQRERIRLMHGSLMYRDARLSGFDAASVVEVIEHLDQPRLRAFERVLFESARPATIALTTPNAEYNVKWPSLPAGQFRHQDHRFEWTRAEFQNWANDVASRFGYAVTYRPVGDEDSDGWSSDADGGVRPMTFTIPELSLVVLIGPSGCGKSTFARKHFKPTEVMSSDGFRALVSDDENDQSSTDDAFAALHFVAARRLARAKLTVVDATNVQPEARKPLVALAREYHVLPVAIVLDLPERVCHERNRSRPDRDFGPHVIRNQRSQLHRSLRGLGREGFRHVHVLKSQEEVDAAVIERQPLWNNRKRETGPFDIIGDVHGCCDELEELLQQLGYERNDGGPWAHPAGRKAIFVGDLVDRGPRIVDTLEDGDVDVSGRDGPQRAREPRHQAEAEARGARRHGLARTRSHAAELEQQTPEFRADVQKFLDGLVSHYVFDDGRLVVAHAGMKEEMQGRGSAKVRDFALFGETTGETDEFGLPVRYNWAAEYRGRASVVYGHTPVPEPEWLNRTINIDTGCVFGGKLTALRWPEKELVSVPARQTYADPVRPFLPLTLRHSTRSRRTTTSSTSRTFAASGSSTTRLHRNVTIREENAAAALEVMSRFAANPKWLIYLPPTMSPSETSKAEGLLEHPAEAFSYYRTNGVSTVVVEQKHMGSRAIVIVCRNQDVARERFGVLEDESWHLLHAHRPSILRRCRAGARAAVDGANCARRSGLLGALEHRLGVPRLRADAVVGEGARACSAAVRVGWNSRSRGPGRNRAGARDRRRAGYRRRRPARTSQDSSGACRTVCALVSPLLLAGRVAARHPHRPVPRHGHRGRGAHGQGSCLAHEHDQQLCPGGRRPVDAHALSGRGPR